MVLCNGLQNGECRLFICADRMSSLARGLPICIGSFVSASGHPLHALCADGGEVESGEGDDAVVEENLDDSILVLSGHSVYSGFTIPFLLFYALRYC